jgi:hypothetical protein
MTKLVSELKSMHQKVINELAKALQNFDIDNPGLACNTISSAKFMADDVMDTITEIEEKIRNF